MISTALPTISHSDTVPFSSILWSQNSNPSMKFCQFLVPESMGSVRDDLRKMPKNFKLDILLITCFTSFREMEMLSCLIKSFILYLTSRGYSAFLLWPVGDAQISFKDLINSSMSGVFFVELLSPLSSLYSLD